MKNKYIYIVISVFLFFLSIPIIAQVRDDIENPGADPEAVPIDNYSWILLLAGLIFGILTLRATFKLKKFPE